MSKTIDEVVEEFEIKTAETLGFVNDDGEWKVYNLQRELVRTNTDALDEIISYFRTTLFTLLEQERKETMRTVMIKMRKLVDEPEKTIYLSEIEETLYELDQEALNTSTHN